MQLFIITSFVNCVEACGISFATIIIILNVNSW